MSNQWLLGRANLIYTTDRVSVSIRKKVIHTACDWYPQLFIRSANFAIAHHINGCIPWMHHLSYSELCSGTCGRKPSSAATEMFAPLDPIRSSIEKADHSDVQYSAVLLNIIEAITEICRRTNSTRALFLVSSRADWTQVIMRNEVTCYCYGGEIVGCSYNAMWFDTR